MRFLLLVFVVVLVNLPAVHQEWTDHRVASRGEDVRAAVIDSRTVDGRHLIDYRLPAEVDPQRTVFSARIDDRAYAAVRATDLITVRVLPGDPGANRPRGEVGDPLLIIAAAVADVILVVVALLTWQRRRRRAANGPDLYDHA